MGDRRSPEYESDPSIGLDEVERALSLLDGRHPDHERHRRELLLSASKRRRAAEKAVQRKRYRKRLVAVVGVVNLVAIAFAAWVTLRVRDKNDEMTKAVRPLVAPFIADGFELFQSSDVTHEHTLFGAIEARTCVVAAAAPGTRLSVTYGAAGEQATAEAVGSAGFCSCAAESFSVSAVPEAGGKQPGWLGLVRADAQRHGGPLAVSYLSARPSRWLEAGGDCVEELFDTWLKGRRPGQSDPSPAASKPVTLLQQEGFAPLAYAGTSRDFVVVEAPAQSCSLALSASGLSLRKEGGERVASARDGALLFCADRAERWAVFGTGGITVLAASEGRLGGVLGAQEHAARAGVTVVSWLPPSNLESDARAALSASGASNITVGEAPVSARLVAFSVVDPAGISPATTDDSFHYCSPPLTRSPKVAICVQSARETWNIAGGGAIAFAPTPFWLSLYAEQPDPDIVRAELAVLAFARRMTGLGFEPTVHEGFAEAVRAGDRTVTHSVKISGLEGDDGVVVVGLARRAPWLFPYTDKQPWKLETDPRVVPLHAGERVALSASLAEEIPRDERRIVVFRKRASR